MDREYSSKPSTHLWDIDIAINALKENAVDCVLFFGFIVSILGSFYFLYWLKACEMGNVCTKNC
ncbi:conserved Plasmodium protein, unknown function [Plasmodium berghei]|uniref:Uncharacterized protein n=2 Tax=Plasmodium berghei TaxID=5821 RepID=A0A509AJR0_PLABA|nr:conserved Plasmodium protein, unknown function [Plasmodium berghei ANKA]CXI51876.1 conserved Plasmodium protein, unknown function [Plasmodium berghei]SCL94507.1 conserved Plasmodium protein, unknown function [Plasmodium berghei]SCM16044.1 conserved Plasmodium protein, unknown function [Plasmodium berghei]SCM17839.1 conserved Plasmodium protein, unknown function [Plasmodium berghei]SCN26120.1 conserved Plasmodium protein, unknown function [Plasmodium berghei]|eukprot:XP_034421968.1 conserved Plasmodium protein, unknown function [Plasmodium berghei ANKA]